RAWRRASWAWLSSLGSCSRPSPWEGSGGGDVKMMGAVGALIGARLGFAALALGMILGGAIMLVHLARVGRLRGKLASPGRMFSLALLMLWSEPLKAPGRSPDAISLPYSVPLALGTLAAVVASHVVGRS